MSERDDHDDEIGQEIRERETRDVCQTCHGHRKVWQPIRSGGAVQVPCPSCT